MPVKFKANSKLSFIFNILSEEIQGWLTTKPYHGIIDTLRSFGIMTSTAANTLTAGFLHAAGAVVTHFLPGDPTPVVYVAGHQDPSTGFVVLTKSAHNQKLDAHRAVQQQDNVKADKKAAALREIAPALKPGRNAAQLQLDGMSRYASLRARSARPSLRPQTSTPAVKPQPQTVAPSAVVLSVGNLGIKKEPQPKQPNLAERMKYWAQGMGVVPGMALNYGS